MISYKVNRQNLVSGGQLPLIPDYEASVDHSHTAQTISTGKFTHMLFH